MLSMSASLVKICGISDHATLQHAVKAGADFVGFVHFRKSPRHVDILMLSSLIKATPSNVRSVVVMVNPDDALLDEIIANAKPDYFQLHGNESPDRVREMKIKFQMNVIKALTVSDKKDVVAAEDYKDAADIILFDAKPPEGAENAGGFGVNFDWNLLVPSPVEKGSLGRTGPTSPLQGEKIRWMLSGGLSSENVAQAMAITHAPMVDVSSHIETPPGSGKKDLDKITRFIEAVKL